MSGTIPQFVMAEASAGDTPNTIRRVAALDAYLVEYLDKGGEKKVRIVFHVPGSSAVFLLAEKVGASALAAEGSEWFKTEFVHALRANEPGEEGVGSI